MPAPADLKFLFETYKSAVLNKDVAALMAIYAPDIIAFDLWDAWSLIGHAPWSAMNRDWLESLGSDTVVVTFADITIIPGVDVAAAHAIVTYQARSATGAPLRAMQNRLTWITERANGHWRIIHQHTSAPIDPDTLTAKLNR